MLVVDWGEEERGDGDDGLEEEEKETGVVALRRRSDGVEFKEEEVMVVNKGTFVVDS